LVWHYSVDALYGAMLMLRSHSLYFKLSGAACAGIVILPIVAALVAYWLRGGFEPAEGLLNADEAGPAPPPAAPAPAAEAAVYRGLGRRARLAAVAVFAAGLATLLVPVEQFGALPRYKLDAGQALPSADAFLRAQDVDPTTFRHVISTAAHWGGDDALAGKYFLGRLPVARASRLFEQYRPVEHWAVRYFRPLDREEVGVSVHPETGLVLGFYHTVPEDRPGADVSDAAAQQIAMGFASSRGLGLASMDLKENSSEKKKARRDHTLVWEARAGDPRNVDEARYRTEISVDGDRVAVWRSYWKIPEAFARGRERQNWISISLAVCRIMLALVITVWGLWLMIGNIRRGLVPWGAALRLAIPAALAAAIAGLLRLPQIYEQYNTAVPLATFQASAYIWQFITVVSAFLGFALAAAFLTSFFPDCVSAFRAVRRRSASVDAVAATLAAAGLAITAGRFEALLNGRFHAQALFDLGAPALIESLSPAISALAGAAQGLLIMGAMVSLIALIAGRLARPWLPPVAVLATLFLVSEEARTPAEFALAYGSILFAGACVLIFCQWFGRRNYLAYALVLWVAALRTPLADLFENPNPRYHAQGWIVLGAALVSIVWLVLPAARNGLSGRASAAL
jgi:hypothetical protein